MSSLYDTYASQTGAENLDHMRDVRRIAEHFRRRILPTFSIGVELQKCSIFEFGAGWGRNLLAMAELGVSELYGIDISEEQVAIGRRLGLNKLELITPGSPLPASVTQSQYDVVLAIDVLEHLDLDALYNFSRLVRKILKPNGLLIVQVPNGLAPFNPIISGDLTHLRGFTLASLRQLLVLSGTEPIHLAGIPFPGQGALHAMRAFISHVLVAPFVRLLSLILYGRSSDLVMLEPNLLGVARATQGTKT